MIDYNTLGWLSDKEKKAFQDEKSEVWGDRHNCEHKYNISELYFSLNANGGKMYYIQCTKCFSSRRVRQGDYTTWQKESAQPLNRDLASDYYSQIQSEKQKKIYRIEEKYHALALRKKQSSNSEYNRYLKSAKWRGKRQAVFARCKKICEGCGVDKATQVHHLTYDRIYNEMLFDLVGVCDQCHKKIHNGE